MIQYPPIKEWTRSKPLVYVVVDKQTYEQLQKALKPSGRPVISNEKCEVVFILESNKK